MSSVDTLDRAIAGSNTCSHENQTEGQAETRRSRSPRLGYALAASAATLWALNGSLARFLLDDHLPAARLSELRALGTAVLIGGWLAARRPELLRIERHDGPRIAFVGVVGFAGVSLFYFAAIARIEIGVALTVQYLAPLLLLLWLRVIHGRPLKRSLWAVAALSATGCFFVVRAYRPGSLDGLGLAAAGAAAITFAIYLFGTEQLGGRYSPLTTLAWGFGCAALFWLIAQPLWTFPWHVLDTPRNAAFAAYVVVGGTLVPFLLMLSAVRHLPAARAAVVATLEPVFGAALAWPIHGQSLSPIQIAGGAIAIGAVVWVQAQRPELDAELAPGLQRRI